ncbi:hypothetical protein [Aeromonas salmonicida]|uniref:hypothetical protein n=1 Tax=Aeromonas salmonicida TaxID=645 RepID=UPI001F22878D|nr:hypothetical protein [Aeromonas salmonicida]MCE9932664.1 hypothetical protein [Aeromonas salmonicida]
MSRVLLPGYWLYQGKVVFKGPTDQLLYVQVFAVAADIVMAIDMMRSKHRSLCGNSRLVNVELSLSQDLDRHPFIESVLGLENTKLRESSRCK